MKNKTVIFFDLDDTIIHTGSVYQEIVSKVGLYLDNLLAQKNFDRKKYLDMVNQVEYQRAKSFAYVYDRRRFPGSLVTVSEMIVKKSGLNLDVKKVKKDVAIIAKSVFNPHNYRFIDGYDDLLTRLQKDFVLILITLGDKKVQQSKINFLELSRFFDEIVVDRHDKIKVIKDMLSKYLPDQSYFVGDSVTRDVLPALDSGVDKAIYVVKSQWSYEDEKDQSRFQDYNRYYEEGRVIICESIAQIESTLFS